MAYVYDPTNKQQYDIDNAMSDSAIIVYTSSLNMVTHVQTNRTGAIRAYDGTHGQSVIADNNTVVDRDRLVLKSNNDKDGNQGESALVGRPGGGNAYD